MSNSAKTLLVVFEFDTLNGGENSMLAVLSLLTGAADSPLCFGSQWQIKAALPCHAASSSSSDTSNNATLLGQLTKLGIETISLTTHLDDGTRKSQDHYRDDFAQVLRRHQPDVVLCNSLSTSRLCGPVTAEANILAAGYLRDIIKLSRKAVADINQLDRIIAVSNATMKFHIEHGMDSQKLRVLYNGVDLEQFHPRLRESSNARHLKQSLNIPARSPVVLFVGQIGMRKGIDVLVEAFGQLLETAPSAHLLIVGQRHSQKQEAIDYEEAAADASERPPLRGHVHWLGRRSDVSELMAVADVLLHPARQEPLGRVLLEAAASGLPVITTLVGGSPEILGCNDSFDLLCRKDDASAMAARVSRLLNDDRIHAAVSSELRNLAVRRFNRENCAKSLSSILDDLHRQRL